MTTPTHITVTRAVDVVLKKQTAKQSQITTLIEYR